MKPQIKPNNCSGLSVKPILLGIAFTLNLFNSSSLTASGASDSWGMSASGYRRPFFMTGTVGTDGRDCSYDPWPSSASGGGGAGGSSGGGYGEVSAYDSWGASGFGGGGGSSYSPSRYRSVSPDVDPYASASSSAADRISSHAPKGSHLLDVTEKPREESAMSWLHDVRSRYSALEDRVHDKIARKDEPVSIQEHLDALHGWAQEICATIGGKYGINSRLATPEERSTIIGCIVFVRHTYSSKLDIMDWYFTDTHSYEHNLETNPLFAAHAQTIKLVDAVAARVTLTRNLDDSNLDKRLTMMCVDQFSALHRNREVLNESYFKREFFQTFSAIARIDNHLRVFHEQLDDNEKFQAWLFRETIFGGGFANSVTSFDLDYEIDLKDTPEARQWLGEVCEILRKFYDVQPAQTLRALVRQWHAEKRGTTSETLNLTELTDNELVELADLGDTDATFEVSRSHHIEGPEKKRVRRIIAASQGHSMAQVDLADNYWEDRNYDDAVFWCRQSIDNSAPHPHALYLLALAAYDGLGGVDEDRDQSYHYALDGLRLDANHLYTADFLYDQFYTKVLDGGHLALLLNCYRSALEHNEDIDNSEIRRRISILQADLTDPLRRVREAEIAAIQGEGLIEDRPPSPAFSVPVSHPSVPPSPRVVGNVGDVAGSGSRFRAVPIAVPIPIETASSSMYPFSAAAMATAFLTGDSALAMTSDSHRLLAEDLAVGELDGELSSRRQAAPSFSATCFDVLEAAAASLSASPNVQKAAELRGSDATFQLSSPFTRSSNTGGDSSHIAAGVFPAGFPFAIESSNGSAAARSPLSFSLSPGADGPDSSQPSRDPMTTGGGSVEGSGLAS